MDLETNKKWEKYCLHLKGWQDKILTTRFNRTKKTTRQYVTELPGLLDILDMTPGPYMQLSSKHHQHLLLQMVKENNMLEVYEGFSHMLNMIGYTLFEMEEAGICYQKPLYKKIHSLVDMCEKEIIRERKRIENA